MCSTGPRENWVVEMEDVIVVGGSYAGLSAAIYLARARRKVLVIDRGLPRNRFSSYSHGVLCHDGRPGSEILETARTQFSKHPTAEFRSAEVRSIVNRPGPLSFEVETSGGDRFLGRHLILATGLHDERPPIEGLEERWGKSVFHCPYCDGFEFGGGPIGVLATLPLSIHFAEIVAEWGDLTLFTGGKVSVEGPEKSRLIQRGIRIVDTPVAALEGDSDGRLAGVRLEGGGRVPIRALFIATLFRQSAPLARDLGCEIVQTPRGPIVKTDESKLTTVAGVYATGDMARPTHSIPFAASDGATAGTGAHQSLVVEGSVG
jgi:thioredoxin reductase